LVSITIDEFVKKYLKSNKSENEKEIREDLLQAVKAKKRGVKCTNCGRPIWAIGSALEGWDACFTCITGEANSSEDYEIDTVN
jgi:hypothetical protein